MRVHLEFRKNTLLGRPRTSSLYRSKNSCQVGIGPDVLVQSNPVQCTQVEAAYTLFAQVHLGRSLWYTWSNSRWWNMSQLGTSIAQCPLRQYCTQAMSRCTRQCLGMGCTCQVGISGRGCCLVGPFRSQLGRPGTLFGLGPRQKCLSCIDSRIPGHPPSDTFLWRTGCSLSLMRSKTFPGCNGSARCRRPRRGILAILSDKT